VPPPVLLLSIAGPTADRIERLLQARGFQVTVETDVAATVSAAAEHGLVILEAADTERLVALTRRMRKQLGGQLPILAVGRGHEVDERVALLEAGADDVIGQPFDERELEALVEALLLRSSAALSDGRAAGSAPAAATRRGQVFVFVATKGGSGATTLAVNVALLLAMRPDTDVAIADLDFYHGQVALHLDVRGDVSTAHLARQRQEDAVDILPTAAAVHSSGLTVFAAPHRPDEGTRVTASDVRRLVDVLRAEHSFVIVDAGTTVDERSLALLQMADRAVIAVTPEIPALRTLHGLLEVLADSGTMSDRTLFVLNQAFPKPMLSAEQIEENLGVKFALQVPYHPRLFSRAVNEGEPLVAAAGRSKQAQQLRHLTSLLLDEGETRETTGRRRFGGLMKRRQARPSG
jgi:pilus assembly protein CpaE